MIEENSIGSNKKGASRQDGQLHGISDREDRFYWSKVLSIGLGSREAAGP